MKKSEDGFTLVELMIVGGIMLVIVSISFLAYQQGVRREYGLSQQARSLNTALQLARVQALDNKTAIVLTNAQSMAPVGTWYTTLRLTAANHGVQTGDYVSLTGLTLVDTTTGSTETPTVGAYYVSTFTNNTFDCVYYHSDQLKVTAATADYLSTSYRPPSAARNLTRSSQLIIRKKSDVQAITDLYVQKAIYASGKYFVYDDKNFIIWDYADEIAGKDINATTYSPIVGFTTRGFCATETGQELRLNSVPARPHAFKIISITPFGQVTLGTMHY